VNSLYGRLPRCNLIGRDGKIGNIAGLGRRLAHNIGCLLEITRRRADLDIPMPQGGYRLHQAVDDPAGIGEHFEEQGDEGMVHDVDVLFFDGTAVHFLPGSIHLGNGGKPAVMLQVFLYDGLPVLKKVWKQGRQLACSLYKSNPNRKVVFPPPR